MKLQQILKKAVFVIGNQSLAAHIPFISALTHFLLFVLHGVTWFGSSLVLGLGLVDRWCREPKSTCIFWLMWTLCTSLTDVYLFSITEYWINNCSTFAHSSFSTIINNHLHACDSSTPYHACDSSTFTKLNQAGGLLLCVCYWLC